MSFEADSPTFTGNVTVPDPTELTDATHKAYVDGVGSRVRHGTVAFTAENAKPVTVTPALPSVNYSVTANADGPVACWVTDKQVGGFTLHTSAPITGSVDWVLVRG